MKLSQVKGKKRTQKQYSSAKTKKTSQYRSKTAVSDIIACNDFEYFGTFTVGHRYCSSEPCPKTPATCSRFDDDLVRTKISQALKNAKKKYPDFKYLIVPERHKSGALHFHGVFSGYGGEIKLTGVIDDKGRQVYELPEFERLGFTDFTRIEDVRKVANYCRKYITKDMGSQDQLNKRRYWGTKDLKKPALRYNLDIKSHVTPQTESKELARNESYTITDYTNLTALPELVIPSSVESVYYENAPLSHTGHAIKYDQPRLPFNL